MGGTNERSSVLRFDWEVVFKTVFTFVKSPQVQIHFTILAAQNRRSQTVKMVFNIQAAVLNLTLSMFTFFLKSALETIWVFSSPLIFFKVYVKFAKRRKEVKV